MNPMEPLHSNQAGNYTTTRRRRPLIGITCYVDKASWGSWHENEPAALVSHTYVEAVNESGGRALLIPPDSLGADIVDVLDGLVLSGGSDIDPALYGATPHPMTTGVCRERDDAELALFAAALRADLPTLGVCRGGQLMAVGAGGSLHQHLPDMLGSNEHRPEPGVYGLHGAEFAADSMVAKVLGEHMKVNSYHHQAIADPGLFTVTGWADDDTVETIEDPTKRFMLGVQWHPEVTEDRRLFAALADAAR